MPLSSYGTQLPPRVAITKHLGSLLHLGGLEHVMMLFTPRFLTGLNDISSGHVPWAADCDGFNGVHVGRYLEMLRKMTYAPGCRFLVVPDVFEAKSTDAQKTLHSFDEWYPVLETVWADVDEQSHQPLALVAQNGVEDLEIPWDRMDALFVGGTTDYKFSQAVRDLVTEARSRGLWVHMGRVNSDTRVTYCRTLDVDSFDGTGIARFTNAMWPRVMKALTREDVPEMFDFGNHGGGETVISTDPPNRLATEAAANLVQPTLNLLY